MPEPEARNYAGEHTEGSVRGAGGDYPSGALLWSRCQCSVSRAAYNVEVLKGLGARVKLLSRRPREFRERIAGFADLALDSIVNATPDRKSTRLNSSHANISYAVFCLTRKRR